MLHPSQIYSCVSERHYFYISYIIYHIWSISISIYISMWPYSYVSERHYFICIYMHLFLSDIILLFLSGSISIWSIIEILYDLFLCDLFLYDLFLCDLILMIQSGTLFYIYLYASILSDLILILMFQSGTTVLRQLIHIQTDSSTRKHQCAFTKLDHHYHHNHHHHHHQLHHENQRISGQVGK